MSRSFCPWVERRVLTFFLIRNLICLRPTVVAGTGAVLPQGGMAAPATTTEPMTTTNYSVGFVVLMACALVACGAHEEHDHDHDHEPAMKEREAGHTENHADEVIWSARAAQAAGVEVDTVGPGPFRAVYKTGGAVLEAAGEEHVVAAPAAGVVHLPQGGFAEGTAVRGGQLLARLSARELTDGDPAEKARLEYEAARKEWERAEALAAEQIISRQQLEDVRLRWAMARAAVDGQGGSPEAGGRMLTAPRNAYVKQCLVRPGEFVSLGQPLFVLTQDRRLRLRAEVPETEAARLATVRSARFRTAASPDVQSLDSLHGTLLSVGRAVTPGTACLPVTFEFDNVGAVLPGSYAEVWLLGAVREAVLSVPRQALVEEQGLFFVYVREAVDRYRKQAVTTGADDGQRVEITSGLQPGEAVVTKGALRVKLAGAASVIPAHNHEH